MKGTHRPVILTDPAREPNLFRPVPGRRLSRRLRMHGSAPGLNVLRPLTLSAYHIEYAQLSESTHMMHTTAKFVTAITLGLLCVRLLIADDVAAPKAEAT